MNFDDHFTKTEKRVGLVFRFVVMFQVLIALLVLSVIGFIGWLVYTVIFNPEALRAWWERLVC